MPPLYLVLIALVVILVVSILKASARPSNFPPGKIFFYIFLGVVYFVQAAHFKPPSQRGSFIQKEPIQIENIKIDREIQKTEKQNILFQHFSGKKGRKSMKIDLKFSKKMFF